MMRGLSLLILLFCVSCTQEMPKVKLHSFPKFDDILVQQRTFTDSELFHTVSGYYQTIRSTSRCYLSLLPDSAYKLIGRHCKGSYIDTGNYFLRGNSIYFKSMFENRDDFESLEVGVKITKLDRGILDGYLLDLNNFYIDYFRKVGLPHFERRGLDTLGNGYGINLDTFGNIIASGEFVHKDFANGFKYLYTKEHFDGTVRVRNFINIDTSKFYLYQ